MNHVQLAGDLFLEGYNCAQAVFVAFCDVTGYDKETALRLSASFGGGVGGLREICGAVSGAAMVAGALWGYTDIDHEGKQQHYRRVSQLAKDFEALYGSVVCRDLMKQVKTAPLPENPRPEEAYRSRPCLRYVETMAGLLDEAIQQQN